MPNNLVNVLNFPKESSELRHFHMGNTLSQNQIGLDDDGLLGFEPVVKELPVQQFPGDLAYFPGIGIDGRQRWLCILTDDVIVNTDDRNILRHEKTFFFQLTNGTVRNVVISADNCGDGRMILY